MGRYCGELYNTKNNYFNNYILFKLNFKGISLYFIQRVYV